MITTGEREFRRIATELNWQHTDEYLRKFGEKLDLLLANQRLMTVRAMQEAWRKWIEECQVSLGGQGTVVRVMHRDGEMPQFIVDAGLAAGPRPIGPFGLNCHCWEPMCVKVVESHEPWRHDEPDGSSFVVLKRQSACQWCGEKRVKQ